MYVRFWGVRGSIPVSNPGCVRSGGNTACVEVRCGQTAFIFDAGSGLRELGADAGTGGGSADPAGAERAS